MNINSLTIDKNYTFNIKEDEGGKHECTLCPIAEELRIKIRAVNPQFILNSNAAAECTIRSNRKFIYITLGLLDGVTNDEVPFRHIIVNHVGEQIFGNAIFSIINCTNKLVTLNEDRKLMIDDKPQDVLLPSSDHIIFVWEDSEYFHIVRQDIAINKYNYSSNQRSNGDLLHL